MTGSQSMNTSTGYLTIILYTVQMLQGSTNNEDQEAGVQTYKKKNELKREYYIQS